MIFSYERKGQAEAPEIFIFQDVFDHQKSIRNLGKPLEPFFKLIYVNLPQTLEWTKLDFMKNFSIHFKKEISPILAESKNQKIAIWSGTTFHFWQILIKDQIDLFKLGVLFNPEMQEISLLPFLQDITNSFRRKSSFTFWNWLSFQPILFQLQFLQQRSNETLPFSIMHIRSEDESHPIEKESNDWSGISIRSEWYSFPSEDFSTLKNSVAVKKLILSRFADESKIKKDRIWSILLQL